MDLMYKSSRNFYAVIFLYIWVNLHARLAAEKKEKNVPQSINNSHLTATAQLGCDLSKSLSESEFRINIDLKKWKRNVFFWKRHAFCDSLSKLWFTSDLDKVSVIPTYTYILTKKIEIFVIFFEIFWNLSDEAHTISCIHILGENVFKNVNAL